jgi:hypothetical protein
MGICSGEKGKEGKVGWRWETLYLVGWKKDFIWSQAVTTRPSDSGNA